MNRQEEFWELTRQLNQPPAALDGTAARAQARARRKRREKRWGISLGSLAGTAAAFILAVNVLPTFALACSHIPILRELAAAVAFSPSLSAAVEHDYVQYVGQKQTLEDVTLTVESLIADERQIVVFYRLEGEAQYYSVSGDLRTPDGEALSGYTIAGTNAGDGLRQLEIRFVDCAVPESFLLDLRIYVSGEADSGRWLDGTWTFLLHLDPEKTAPTITVAVGQWFTLDGQRLLVDRLELTPTRTAIYLGHDPDNTAWLQNLKFHFTGPDGTEYTMPDGALTATGEPDSPGFYTYYFQSFYFLDDPASLTLWIDRAIWLDKEAPALTVDLTDGTHTGRLPEGIPDVAVEEQELADLGRQKVLVVTTETDRAPFQNTYFDPQGGSHDFDSCGMEMAYWDDDGTYHPWQYRYILEDYGYDTVELSWDYTRVTNLTEPLAVPLR